MKLTDYQDTKTIDAMVLYNKRITPPEAEEVREIALQVNRLFNPAPGQSIGFEPPGTGRDGQKNPFRLYTVANLPDHSTRGISVITIAVKRCNYLDEFSGETCKGIASNYLCDLDQGQTIKISGPFGLPFQLPTNLADDLVLIGAGTGIAPFRAFVKKLYKEQGERKGKVYLFHGARTGLELLYNNDETDDLTQYYDKATFEAFMAVSPQSNFADPLALDYAIERRAKELWQIMQKPTTRVYLAGQPRILTSLDRIFSAFAGSPEAWAQFKQRLVIDGRWQEILF